MALEIFPRLRLRRIVRVVSWVDTSMEGDLRVPAGTSLTRGMYGRYRKVEWGWRGKRRKQSLCAFYAIMGTWNEWMDGWVE